MSPQGLASNPVRGNNLMTNPDQSISRQGGGRGGEIAVSIRCCLPRLLRDLVTGAEQLVCDRAWGKGKQSTRSQLRCHPAGPCCGSDHQPHLTRPALYNARSAAWRPGQSCRFPLRRDSMGEWGTGQGGSTAPSCPGSRVPAPRLLLRWQLLPVFRQRQPLRMPSCAAGDGLLATRAGAALTIAVLRPRALCLSPEPFA